MNTVYKLLTRLTTNSTAKYITDFSSIRIESLLPSWLILFVVIGIFLLSFKMYLRDKSVSLPNRIILALLRSIAYIIIFIMLIRPIMEIEGRGCPPGKIPVIVDASESMNINDMNGKKRISCADLVLEEIKKSSKSMEKFIKPEYFRAGAKFEPISGEKMNPGDADYTSINQMINKGIDQVLGDYCPGLILISDGAHNTSEVPETILDSLCGNSIPLYVVGIGKEKSKDISIQYLIGEDIVFIDEKAKLFVNYKQSGYTGKNFELDISLGEDKVYSGVHTVEKDGENYLPLEYIPKQKGLLQLKASIKPFSDEVTDQNNVYIKNVRVIDERIRVLLFFGTPSWEMRYLIGAFERDKRVDFKVFLQDVDKRIFRANSPHNVYLQKLPINTDEINNSFDIIIMSRINLSSEYNLFLDSVSKFVEEKGGSLVVLCDPYYLPYSLKNSVLEQLLPIGISEIPPRAYQDELFNISKESFGFELTDDGQNHPLVAFSPDKEENSKMWIELPYLNWIYEANRLKPSAINLVNLIQKSTNRSFPGIVFHSYGKGMVFLHTFDSTWRWRKEFGDRFFRDYWAKLIQFAGLPHLLEESARSAIFAGSENCYVGERISIRARLSNPDFSVFTGDSAEAYVTEAGLKKTVKLSPVQGRSGVYRGFFMPEIPGILKIEMEEKFSAPPIEIVVSKRQKEFTDSGMNKALLEKLCTKSGGKFYDFTSYEKLIKDIVKNRPKVLIQAKVEIWDSFILLLLVLIILSVEWLIRKFRYLD
ncbi:MAG TPA: hypothetical protein P5105_01590 [Victivallales bacterium]|nr:hypothetical protein [Victivallales bacterium]HRR05948.1 hypothetical protein [Victivallales bacterium]